MSERELKELVHELQAELERLSSAAETYGSVIHVVGNGEIVIATQGGQFAIGKYPAKKPLKLGQTVRVIGQTLQPVGPAEVPLVGAVQVVSKKNEAGVFISRAGQNTRVLVADGVKVQEGSRVLMDPSGLIIVKELEHNEETRTQLEHPVRWTDIIGQDQAKLELQEIVELSTVNSKVVGAYGYAPPKGVLLYGPPGCGKTMLAKATATAFGSDGFISVKGPQVLDPYVGVAEATVRELFAGARAYHQKSGKRAILFIDEADAILGSRGHFHAHMERTIVPAFLAEMDGLVDSKAIVVLATNRPDSLDPAVVREGRIDRKIEVARPTQAHAESLLAHLLKDKPNQDKPDVMARHGAERMYCTTNELYRLLYSDGSGDIVTLADIASGAMITAVAEHALTSARRRDMKAGKVRGVEAADVLDAVDSIYHQNIGLNHDDVLRARANNKTIKHLEKINAKAA